MCFTCAAVKGNMRAEGEQLMESALGVILGAVISWAVSWYFYKRSGDELRREAARLRELVNMTITGLERAKLIDVQRDGSGEPLHIDIRGKLEASSLLSEAHLESTTSPPPR